MIDATTVTARLTQPASRVMMLGASGDGKTHTAQHAAAHLTDAGHLVVWLSADDYRKNDFGVLLSRAVSPYSTEAAWALLHKAADSGITIVVIVDALQASGHRDELLSQLNALLLKLPASALINTSRDDDVNDLFEPTTRISLCAPEAEERAQIAANFGNNSAGTDFGEYRTRYDVSVAAQVITDLPAGATRTDVLDAYVSQMAPRESVRAALRCVATAMDENVVTMIPVNEVAAKLRRCPPLKAEPSAFDAVLASRLVVIHQGRLRFSHERQGRFLAAEHLVVSAADGAALGEALKAPTHADLRQDALGIERDPSRRYWAIRVLADEELFAAAAMGRFGLDTSRLCLAEMAELLITARVATAGAVFDEQVGDDQFWSCSWHCPRPWSPIERRLLRAIGRCVLNGMLITEVAELLDETDRMLRPAMIALSDKGSPISTSVVFASAYAHQYPRAADALPASYVCGAIDTERRWDDEPDCETGLATAMWRPHPSWGRLHAAVLLSRPLRHPDDLKGALDLIRAAWRAGGYHLRLEVLETARFAYHAASEQDRNAIADFLETLDVSYSIGLSSALLEVLGMCGRIQPANSLEDINAEIAGALADPDDPQLQQQAVSLVSRQYEDETVFGPYAEAIDALPAEQRLTLNAMAVLAPADYVSFGYPGAIRELADHVTTQAEPAGRALSHAARRIRLDTICRQDSVAAHLHALRGWAKVADRLPVSAPSDNTDEPAVVMFTSTWRLIDELLFPLIRGEQLATDLADFIWDSLLTRCPLPAAAVHCDIRTALIAYYNNDAAFAPHQLLEQAYPDRIRALMLHALTHRKELKDWDASGAQQTIVAVLAEVGDHQTAEILRHYVHHPELGATAIAAIKTIESRTDVAP